MTSSTTRLVRLLSALLALVIGQLLAFAPLASAQDDEPATDRTIAVVHRVDARGDLVEAAVLLDDYVVSPDEVAVNEHGDAVTVESVKRASTSGHDLEVVFVVDTSQRLAKGEVLNKVSYAIATAIGDLPAGTTVAIVEAGQTATVVLPATTDHTAAAAAARNLRLSDGASVFNAIDRAGSMLDFTGDKFSTVVVFSGGEDLSSTITSSVAGVSLIQRGAQLVAVRYQGGESSLSRIVSDTGGVALGASEPAQVEGAVADAVRIASDRLLVTYDGTTSMTERGDAVLSVGSANSSYSYPGGQLTKRPVALGAVEKSQPSGIAFFRSTAGLYVAIGLAFAGIGLGVYALGAVFASGETSLDGLLDRYSGEGDGADLDDEEQALVQTALVKRAVEFSETFAEDQGFLGKVEDLLERAKLPLRPGEAMSIYVAAIFFGGAFGFFLFGGFFGMFLLAVLTGVILLWVIRFKARRRMRAFEQQLPDTLQLLAGTLRAGYSLPQGLEAVSHEISDPMGYELRRVMTEARLGRELEDAMGSTAERLNSPDFAWAVMAIGIQREVGGNLNELLMTVSDTMVARERLKGEVAALTAEGKMSAMILAGLPPGLGFIMWIMNPEYINVLFSETLGFILLGVGFLFGLIGMAWMKKVITINV